MNLSLKNQFFQVFNRIAFDFFQDIVNLRPLLCSRRENGFYVVSFFDDVKTYHQWSLILCDEFTLCASLVK